VSSALRVDDRVYAERALDAIARLIETHEDERRQIAQTLHGDLSQRIALLVLRIEALHGSRPQLSAKATAELDDIRKTVLHIASDVHVLARDLHPSKLESLGLVPSISSYCKDFSMKQGMDIRFVHSGLPVESLRPGVALCVYRVVQEGLWNVKKHSGTLKAEVRLIGSPAATELYVSDAGSGFDAQSSAGTTGIGLVIMRERLRHIGGQMLIDSRRGHGTRIYAAVPTLDSRSVRSVDIRKKRNRGCA